MKKYMTLNEEIERLKEMYETADKIQRVSTRFDPSNWQDQNKELITSSALEEGVGMDNYITNWVDENFTEDSINKRNFVEVIKGLLKSFGLENASTNKIVNSKLMNASREEIGAWIKSTYEGNMSFTSTWMDIADNVVNFLTDILKDSEYAFETDVDNEPYAPNDDIQEDNSLDTERVCKIINDKFTWILEVDGHRISFNGHENADYFEKLYSKLGYKIIRDNDKWDREY